MGADGPSGVRCDHGPLVVPPGQAGVPTEAAPREGAPSRAASCVWVLSLESSGQPALGTVLRGGPL